MEETERAKFVVVKASELGLNCWLPVRFLKQCYRCNKYLTCKYPERVSDKNVDALLARREALREEARRVEDKLRELNADLRYMTRTKI